MTDEIRGEQYLQGVGATQAAADCGGTRSNGRKVPRHEIVR